MIVDIIQLMNSRYQLKITLWSLLFFEEYNMVIDKQMSSFTSSDECIYVID
jgi:hypothetical protein